jgi:superfamily II DNA or RNA helicase
MTTCTIVIKDEVNCKIVDLDLTDRKYLADKFKFFDPSARYKPAVRLGRWDGKVPFFQLGGSTYINLLDQIIPILESRGYTLEVEDLREYNTKFSFDAVKEDSFSHCQWPTGHEDAGKPIMLRDYQIESINKFLSDPQCLQEVATGAGKTLITAVLSQRIEKYGRSVVIVPSKSLVKQTEADYTLLGLDVGVYFGDRKEYNKTHTICTWQSLNNLLKATQEGEADIHEFIDGIVCFMVDEAHAAKADVLKTLLTGVLSQIPIRWGLTGTIPKEEFEKTTLVVSIGNIIHRLSAKDLQDKDVLANCHVNIKQLVDFGEYKDYPSEVKYLVENEERMDFIAQQISAIAQTGNTLVLVGRIETGKQLSAKLSTLFGVLANKPEVVFVNGSTKVDDRSIEYKEMSTSNNKTLVATYGVAAVGINMPRIFNLVMVEPGKSFVRVIQSIGRGLRKAHDKDFVNLYDFTSTLKFSKRHLLKRKSFYKDAQYPFTMEKLEWQ